MRARYISIAVKPSEVLACAAALKLTGLTVAHAKKLMPFDCVRWGHRLEKDYPAAIAAFREALDLWRTLAPESRTWQY